MTMPHLAQLAAEGYQGELLENVMLSSVVYYRIGGRAEFFARPRSPQDILLCLQYFAKKNVPVQIIGGGSNLLVREGGIQGVVLYLGPGLDGDFEVLNESTGEIEVRVPSHWAKSQILKLALERGWEGLEFSAGIPGTLGGAVWMNAGTKWGSYADVIERVGFCHPDRGFYSKDKKAIGFTYRGHGEGLLDALTAISSVDFKFKKSPAASPSSRKLVDEILSYRGLRQPLEFANCGSVFKNPADSKRGAGRLIEAAGLKGTQIGQAMVSLKHANFIVNLGGATAADVESLINLCRAEVNKQFGIMLEPEVIILGAA